MPKVVEDLHNIDGPVIVKYAGAKGGRGYFIAEITVISAGTWTLKKNSPSRNTSSAAGITSTSSLTRRPKTATSAGRAHAGRTSDASTARWTGGTRATLTNSQTRPARDREMALEPSFVVTGNQPVVIRESLLPRA